MAIREWSLEAEYIEFCSCDFGCPCESMAPPTRGECNGAVGFKITKGECDGVILDDLVVVATFYFPRSVADNVVFMDEGEIVESGPPGTFFDNPKNDRTKLFLKQILSH